MEHHFQYFGAGSKNTEGAILHCGSDYVIYNFAQVQKKHTFLLNNNVKNIATLIF